MKCPKSEAEFYSPLVGTGRVVVLVLESGIQVRGQIQWLDAYSIGFAPEGDPGSPVTVDSSSSFGMRAGHGSLIMKGSIRLVTPVA